MRNEGQDGSYSAMKEAPRNARIGFLGWTRASFTGP